MPIAEVPVVSLQSTVDRYAQAMKVPAALYSLHPRNSDVASRALRPAMVMCAIAAFEGFAEEVLAVGMQMREYPPFEIAAEADLSTPDLTEFEEKIDKIFPGAVDETGRGFGLELWRQPAGDSGRWPAEELTWVKVKTEAQAWMQVRHCLAQGVASGWGGEPWPPPMRKEDHYVGPAASSVLRETAPGRYSLAIRCAFNCCRIYRYGAQHLASQLAEYLIRQEAISQELDWKNVPDFALD